MNRRGFFRAIVAAVAVPVAAPLVTPTVIRLGFGPPKFIGKSYVLEDAPMRISREAAQWEIHDTGVVIGHNLPRMAQIRI